MAKGKYAGIIDTLPKSLGTEPEHQDKINALKLRILQPEVDDEEPLSSEVLEDLIMEVTTMQELINDKLIRAVGGNLHASRLARVFADIRKMKNAFEKQEKVTNILLEAYGQILSEQYEAEATTSIKLEDGASVRIQYEPHGTVIDKDANRKWAIANGLENLLSLPWQTVNALTKQALLDGNPEPDGVEATARTKIVYTKA